MEKTIQNLTKAFVGESQARNRYTFYAKVAMKEGYEQIGALFMETAEQEKTHAKRLFEHITDLNKKGENVEAIKVEAEAPVIYGTTIENLKTAIAGEHHETAEMYPEFAKTAEEEGLTDIANRLKAIGRAEAHHKERYQKLLKELEAGTIFKKNQEVEWMCRECGYVHTGITPPAKCPSCDHPPAFYQIKCEQY